MMPSATRSAEASSLLFSGKLTQGQAGAILFHAKCCSRCRAEIWKDKWAHLVSDVDNKGVSTPVKINQAAVALGCREGYSE